MTNSNAVACALQAPAVPASRVLHRRELLPAAPGFYSWWARRGVIPSVPHVPHPADDEVSLLYIGISPVRATSRQTVRSRVVGNHLNGNIGSSTFRYVLAALLVDALELRPFSRGRKVALDASDNARLSAWQREHLLLTWCTRERPWEIEGEVIALLGAPLNSAGNMAHEFHVRVRAARAELKRRATAQH
jgi:GIY-YIG catalytic domain